LYFVPFARTHAAILFASGKEQLIAGKPNSGSGSGRITSLKQAQFGDISGPDAPEAVGLSAATDEIMRIYGEW
jgi:hypothetical protein